MAQFQQKCVTMQNVAIGMLLPPTSFFQLEMSFGDCEFLETPTVSFESLKSPFLKSTEQRAPKQSYCTMKFCGFNAKTTALIHNRHMLQ